MSVNRQNHKEYEVEKETFKSVLKVFSYILYLF